MNDGASSPNIVGSANLVSKNIFFPTLGPWDYSSAVLFFSGVSFRVRCGGPYVRSLGNNWRISIVESLVPSVVIFVVVVVVVLT